MDPEELNKHLLIAQNAVKGLEEPFKTIAFNKLIQKLLDETTKSTFIKKKIKKSTGVKKSKKNIKDETIIKLTSNLNRSEHQDLYLLKKTLDRALYILKIAKDIHNIDGLTSFQISEVLTNCFRIKTSKESVSMVLMDEHFNVNRSEIQTDAKGKVFVYKLMQKGEDYLQKIINELKKNEK